MTKKTWPITLLTWTAIVALVVLSLGAIWAGRPGVEQSEAFGRLLFGVVAGNTGFLGVGLTALLGTALIGMFIQNRLRRGESARDERSFEV